MGLDVIYVHVETNDVPAAYFGEMHTGKHAPFGKNINHVGSQKIYIKHAPLFQI